MITKCLYKRTCIQRRHITFKTEMIILFGDVRSSLFKALYETCETYLQFSPEDVQLILIMHILYKKKCHEMENLMFIIATKVFWIGKGSLKSCQFVCLFILLFSVLFSILMCQEENQEYESLGFTIRPF